MKTAHSETQALRFLLLALALILVMLGHGLINGPAAGQEAYEAFLPVEEYRDRLAEAPGALRMTLFYDFLFMIGYGGGLVLSAWAHRARLSFRGK